MNREIKFRAWDIVLKKWVFKTNESPFYIIGETTVFDMLNQYRLEQYNDIEIQQFTGLQDKNEKDIYEGDILSLRYKDEMEPSGYGEDRMQVIFRNGAFGWEGTISKDFFPFYEERPQDTEVIGNIYENAELLKEKT